MEDVAAVRTADSNLTLAREITEWQSRRGVRTGSAKG